MRRSTVKLLQSLLVDPHLHNPKVLHLIFCAVCQFAVSARTIAEAEEALETHRFYRHPGASGLVQ